MNVIKIGAQGCLDWREGVQEVKYTAQPPGWEDRDVTSGVRTQPLVSPPCSQAPDWER